MSPAVRKSAQADAKQAPAIVMMADANGQPKDLTVKAKPKSKAAPTSVKSSKAKPAAKTTKSTKTTPRSRSKTAASKAPDLDAAADQLLANASGKAAGTPQSAADTGTTSKEEKAKADAKAKVLASIKVGPKGVYTEDSIRVYLQEIGRIRLLRPDEEIELARKIADLLYLEELAAQFESDNGREPDNKEWAALVEMPLIRFRRRLMLGRRAKEKMVQSNLRLVVSIAKKFNEPSYSFDELISEGNVALMRSVEKFNFALGNRFSTYATYAIQRHFFRISHKSRQYRNRFATDDEPVRDRAEEPRDEEACTPGQVDFLRGLFGKFLNELEPREQQIVVARFGFDGDKPKTFRELGIEMGVCKERIRQIQTRAIEKLKTMAEEAQLEQTVGDWL